MKREIEFRGKTASGEWVYGTMLAYLDVCEMHSKHPELLQRVDPDTVGQYTGLKDKHGTKIYEGDVLRDPAGNLHVVEWTEGLHEHMGTTLYTAGFDMMDYPFDQCELAGNTHDNPELCT